MPFRSRLTPEQIQQGLGTIRKRRMVVAAMFVAFLPTTLLGIKVSEAFGFEAERTAMVVFILYATAWAVAGFVLWQSICPRCYSGFFQVGTITNLTATKCGTCGLRLDGTPDA